MRRYVVIGIMVVVLAVVFAGCFEPEVELWKLDKEQTNTAEFISTKKLKDGDVTYITTFPKNKKDAVEKLTESKLGGTYEVTRVSEGLSLIGSDVNDHSTLNYKYTIKGSTSGETKADVKVVLSRDAEVFKNFNSVSLDIKGLPLDENTFDKVFDLVTNLFGSDMGRYLMGYVEKDLAEDDDGLSFSGTVHDTKDKADCSRRVEMNEEEGTMNVYFNCYIDPEVTSMDKYLDVTKVNRYKNSYKYSLKDVFYKDVLGETKMYPHFETFLGYEVEDVNYNVKEYSNGNASIELDLYDTNGDSERNNLKVKYKVKVDNEIVRMRLSVDDFYTQSFSPQTAYNLSIDRFKKLFPEHEEFEYGFEQGVWEYKHDVVVTLPDGRERVALLTIDVGGNLAYDPESELGYDNSIASFTVDIDESKM